jgi:hypothetical protein
MAADPIAVALGAFLLPKYLSLNAQQSPPTSVAD